MSAFSAAIPNTSVCFHLAPTLFGAYGAAESRFWSKMSHRNHTSICINGRQYAQSRGSHCHWMRTESETLEGPVESSKRFCDSRLMVLIVECHFAKSVQMPTAFICVPGKLFLYNEIYEDSRWKEKIEEPCGNLPIYLYVPWLSFAIRPRWLAAIGTGSGPETIFAWNSAYVRLVVDDARRWNTRRQCSFMTKLKMHLLWVTIKSYFWRHAVTSVSSCGSELSGCLSKVSE